jgi:hypothetical protein
VKIDSSHFETLENLLDTIKYWYDIDEIDYDRWFGLEEMKILVDEIERLHSIIKETIEYIENHSITDMEWFITGEQNIECKFMKNANPQELLEILDKENK